MSIKELENYFNRKESSIRKAIRKMRNSSNKKYKVFVDNKVVILKEGVEWLSINILKHKYLELLENYKMELTEAYIEAGYPYDEFFGLN